MKISHPWIHDLFKSALNYDKEEVIKRAKPFINSNIWEPKEGYTRILSKAKIEQETKTSKWHINEINQHQANIDCVWFFDTVYSTAERCPGRENFLIFHEIKTGEFDLCHEILRYCYQTYNFRKFNEYTNVWDDCKVRITGAENQLWIWGWRDILIKKERSIDNEVVAKLCHQRRVRLIPLDYIYPYVREKTLSMLKT
jgi:hypothetical protein